ncbi:MAG TPA: nitroreductase family protein, partial [Spirochaetota bacterium]|nr:nitroreductase family protein [Spirochaetota bacterium]
MIPNDVIKAIIDRRSIRKYTKDHIDSDNLHMILEAGRWAPSGLNNQPWSFIVARGAEIKNSLSTLTHYSRIIKQCDLCICVMYDIPNGYNRDKDLMSIGACIQNMLLAAHSLGIGSVWLGEILNRKSEVNALLAVGDDFELMAVIALGCPAQTPRSSRKQLESL